MGIDITFKNTCRVKEVLTEELKRHYLNSLVESGGLCVRYVDTILV